MRMRHSMKSKAHQDHVKIASASSVHLGSKRPPESSQQAKDSTLTRHDVSDQKRWDNFSRRVGPVDEVLLRF
jgi:hypothetical protein